LKLVEDEKLVEQIDVKFLNILASQFENLSP